MLRLKVVHKSDAVLYHRYSSLLAYKHKFSVV